MTTVNNNPFVVALATTSLIVMGLLLNLVTALFPLCLWTLQPPAQAWYYALPVVLVQATHLYLLWTDPGHTAAYRFLTLPLRRALQPIVMFLIKQDAVKEKEDVAFLRLDEIRHDSSGDNTIVDVVLQSFRPSVRRRYRKILKTFAQAGMVVQSVQGETALHLAATLPILWQHQKRQCKVDGNNLVEAVIKRFLVVSVVPDGILDLFYNADGELVAFQMGTRQGAVYDWFMYFCKDEARQSGIWFYGILLSIVRAKSLPGVTWFNALTHLLDSKTRAGLQITSHQNEEMMDVLFPWASTERMPDNALPISLLNKDSDDDDDEQKTAAAVNGQQVKSIRRHNKTKSR